MKPSDMFGVQYAPSSLCGEGPADTARIFVREERNSFAVLTHSTGIRINVPNLSTFSKAVTLCVTEDARNVEMLALYCGGQSFVIRVKTTNGDVDIELRDHFIPPVGLLHAERNGIALQPPGDPVEWIVGEGQSVDVPHSRCRTADPRRICDYALAHIDFDDLCVDGETVEQKLARLEQENSDAWEKLAAAARQHGARTAVGQSLGGLADVLVSQRNHYSEELAKANAIAAQLRLHLTQTQELAATVTCERDAYNKALREIVSTIRRSPVDDEWVKGAVLNRVKGAEYTLPQSCAVALEAHLSDALKEKEYEYVSELNQILSLLGIGRANGDEAAVMVMVEELKQCIEALVNSLRMWQSAASRRIMPYPASTVAHKLGSLLEPTS